jgi:hypothetical protein
MRNSNRKNRSSYIKLEVLAVAMKSTTFYDAALHSLVYVSGSFGGKSLGPRSNGRKE